MTFLIHPEDHGTFEAMVLGENAGDGRADLFGPVFVVAGEEDDVLTDTYALLALVDNGSVGGFGMQAGT